MEVWGVNSWQHERIATNSLPDKTPVAATLLTDVDKRHEGRTRNQVEREVRVAESEDMTSKG